MAGCLIWYKSELTRQEDQKIAWDRFISFIEKQFGYSSNMVVQNFCSAGTITLCVTSVLMLLKESMFFVSACSTSATHETLVVALRDNLFRSSAIWKNEIIFLWSFGSYGPRPLFEYLVSGLTTGTLEWATPDFLVLTPSAFRKNKVT